MLDDGEVPANEESSTGAGGRGKGGRGAANDEGAAPMRSRPSITPSSDAGFRAGQTLERWLFTSFVISNMVTFFLPPNTGRSLSSALICRLFCGSCRLFFLM